MKIDRPAPESSAVNFNHRYGQITDKEAAFLDGLLSRLKAKFGVIRFLEIGVCGGGTQAGVYERSEAISCPVHCAGVDFWEMRPSFTLPAEYIFYQGDSAAVWKNIKEEFNLLFVDGCHCQHHSMIDFLNYSPLVAVGGFCLFHDTAGINGGTEQVKMPQYCTVPGQSPETTGVREGLRKLGLLQGHRSDWKFEAEVKEPERGGLFGMLLFKKTNSL